MMPVLVLAALLLLAGLSLFGAITHAQGTTCAVLAFLVVYLMEQRAREDEARVVGARITEALHDLEGNMSAGLERLTSEVAESAGVVQSAVVAIQGLSERVRNLEPTQAAINALADDLDANANALAAAIAAIPPPPSQG